MKITVLCEDTALDSRFQAEHGLSLLIETDRHTILFDAGQSDVFMKNAQALGLSLEAVDLVVLSHGHYDHGNGLLPFLQANQTATVYLREEAFNTFYHGERYIGLSERLRAFSDRFHVVSGDEPISIDSQVALLPARSLPKATPSALTEQKDGRMQSDAFDHEQYLLLTQGEYRVLFTGCAHRGIEAIAEEACKQNATHLIGGFHLSDETDDAALQRIASCLLDSRLSCYTGHCTGESAYRRLSDALQSRLHRLRSGLQFVIGDHAEKARFLFRLGYNCSQSVFGAFAEDLGLELSTAVKLACSFGGGMGRLRETCGAVSGMLLVCGMCKGYETPETGAVKAEHYRLVQELVHTFRAKHGSIVCRELLGGKASDSPIPTARTPEFYRTRPCERCIASAASIAEETLFRNP